MANERITENLVRSMLKDTGYYDDSNIVIEEQKSKDKKINNCLSKASKSGNGKGYPEFILSYKNNPDDIIIIECKAEISKHESQGRDNPKDYAVDGALHYARHLKDDFNITVVAVSGQNERETRVSTFLWLKDNLEYKNIQDKKILSPKDLKNTIIEQSAPLTESDLTQKAIEYNDNLNCYSIPEGERCILISSCLIALEDNPFRSSFYSYEDNKDLMDNLFSASERVLNKRILTKEDKPDNNRINIILDEYKKIKNTKDFISPHLDNRKSKKKEINTILKDFIKSLLESIYPYVNKSKFDILGKFYTLFIRYAGGDNKTGLVLTPMHITDFFCEIADLNENDIVFDPCCGTGGFLVSSMNYMLSKAGNDSSKKDIIKTDKLWGIEKRADMFSHACSNMMMRGDGKSHIYFGSCFDDELLDIIKDQKPTKGFLNPPYDMGAANQLEFVENTLECLSQDGLCISICQMSTAVGSNKKLDAVKERLLEKHTLEAVFSMPSDLFHPVGVNTVILIFKAHSPHPKGKESFFGYFKDDGFLKVKNKGRLDVKNKWNDIKENWLNIYRNKKVISGLSVMQEITFKDEWVAEAYMETDYSTLSEDDFIKTIKNYVAFKVKFDDKN